MQPNGARLTYLRVTLEAKVNHHNGREQHNGENHKHQEQIHEKDQEVDGGNQQGPGQAAPGAPSLPGKELVIHVIWWEAWKHPRLLREVSSSKVLSVLARHSSRRPLMNPHLSKRVSLLLATDLGRNFQRLFLPLPHRDKNT